MPKISGSLVVETAMGGGTSFEVTLGEDRLSFSMPNHPSPERLLPGELLLHLKEWRQQRRSSRWFGLQVSNELRALRWADALQAVLEDDPIAWVIPSRGTEGSKPTPSEALRLLLSVWIDPTLPGLKKEIEGLTALSDRGIRTAVALSPTGEHLEARLKMERPTILHLALRVASPDSPDTLRYRDEVSGEWREILANDLVSGLPAESRLVVLNTCHATAVAQKFTRRKGIMTIAWAREVSDDRALAFALFLYEQLLRGTSPADAILMFTDQPVSSNADYRDIAGEEYSPPSTKQTPVVFVPDYASLELQLVVSAERSRVAQARARGGTMMGTPVGQSDSWVSASPGGPSVRPLAQGIAPLQLEVREAINPALLVNGRDPLKALRIISDHEIRRAVIEVTCDTGMGQSHVRRMIDLVAGMTTIDVSELQFPALYELLRLNARRRPINFCVRLMTGDTLLAEETRSSAWMAQDEWVDSPDTYEFLPAFIHPESQAVRSLWTGAGDRITAVARTTSLDGETASENGTAGLYVKALYLALRDKKLRYIQPPPQRIGPRGQRFVGQRVRSPEEVLKEGRGTCHDLSLLFAACMEHIRLYPLVVLIPGHTFVGYWPRSSEHSAYWNIARPWQIKNKHELRDLVTAKKVVLLEATAITDPDDVSFEDACTQGAGHLSEGTRPFDVAIDVRASRSFVDTIQ
jgi:hypothetical protein